MAVQNAENGVVRGGWGHSMSWAMPPLARAHTTSHSTFIETMRLSYTVFTARCYASAVLAIAQCLSVCPSQVGFLLKRLNVGSHKQHHTIVQGLYFSEAKDLREIRQGPPPTGAPNAGGVGQNRRLSTNNRLYLENGTR